MSEDAGNTLTIMTVGDRIDIRDEVGTDGQAHPARPIPISGQDSQTDGPRIALLTPYTGGNYGDGAIQDAMIANMRLRFPAARFSGISLNCESFVERHDAGAYPICATGTTLYGMARGTSRHIPQQSGKSNRPQTLNRRQRWVRRMRNALGKTPIAGPCLHKARISIAVARQEIRHSIEGYRFLRAHDLLVVSGGGQIDEEWGGPWGHPFALFKWAILARLARVPFAVASVGAGKLSSSTSRYFSWAALRVAAYRSYRDRNSREIAAGLYHRAKLDPVVPDLAFSLPSTEVLSSNCIRKIAGGRKIVAVSPMAFAKPGNWPFEDAVLYSRYLRSIAGVISQLLERDGFIVMVWSAQSDQKVIQEIFEYLDDRSKDRLQRQMHIPEISSWRDLVAALLNVDFLVASRLHSTILGFVTLRPTVAISFDPKVDWMMEDLGQTDALLQIRDFEPDDVIRALDRLESRRQSVTEQIRSYRQRAVSELAMQYDTIAALAGALHPHLN